MNLIEQILAEKKSMKGNQRPISVNTKFGASNIIVTKAAISPGQKSNVKPLQVRESTVLPVTKPCGCGFVTKK